MAKDGLSLIKSMNELSREDNLFSIIKRGTDFSSEIANELSKLDDLLQVWYVKKPIDNIGKEILDVLLEKGVDSEIAKFLSSDIQNIVHNFSDLTNDNLPFVSFRTIDDRYFSADKESVSSHWHIDTSVLTLACTYSGKTTQWIHDDSVIDRGLFAKEKIRTIPEVDGSNISEAEINDIFILKGEIRSNENERSIEFLEHFISREEIVPFNENKGLIHRGPGFIDGDQLRTLLTVNTFKRPKRLSRHY